MMHASRSEAGVILAAVCLVVSPAVFLSTGYALIWTACLFGLGLWLTPRLRLRPSRIGLASSRHAETEYVSRLVAASVWLLIWANLLVVLIRLDISTSWLLAVSCVCAFLPWLLVSRQPVRPALRQPSSVSRIIRESGTTPDPPPPVVSLFDWLTSSIWTMFTSRRP